MANRQAQSRTWRLHPSQRRRGGLFQASMRLEVPETIMSTIAITAGTVSTRAPFHMETGKGTTSKVLHFQLRPNPLAQ